MSESMKMYFERPHEGKDEELVGSRVGKVNPTGEAWDAFVKEQRNDHIGLDSNIFGEREYDNLALADRTGPTYEKFVEGELPTHVINTLVARAKKFEKARCKSLSQSLVECAKRNPDAVERLFYDYLSVAKDVDAAIRELGFDDENFEYGEDDVDMMAFINVDKNQEPEQFARQRQKFIADEIAKILAHRYQDGYGVQWKNTPQFREIIRVHIERMEKKEKALKKRVKDYEKKLRPILHAAIGANKLPLDPSVVDERLGEVPVSIADDITATLSESRGDYSVHTRSIRLSSSIPLEHEWKVYVHEIMHSLAGNSVELMTTEFEGLDSAKELRTGVDFERHDYSGPALRWLNEAITESLAMQLTKTKQGSYVWERDLYDLLLSEGGLSQDMFTAAYFDNFDGEKLPGSPTPQLKKIFDETNRVFGKGFLVALDWYIEKRGSTKADKEKNVREALQLWKKIGDGFPQYVIGRFRDTKEREKSSAPKKGKRK